MSDDLKAAEALEALRSIPDLRIEYKADVSPAVLDISGREVTALFSVDNLDSVGDITEVSAFKRSIDHRSEKIPHLFMHLHDQPAIARPLSFQPLSRKELPTDVQLLYPEATGGWSVVSRYLKKGKGDEVYEGLTEGIAYQMSFGYRVINADKKTLPDGRKARRITELQVYEVSTTLPGHAANDATRVRLGKALVLIEQLHTELKAGWRHGTHAERNYLLQMRAWINEMLGSPEPLPEPAPLVAPARTSAVDELIAEIEQIL